MTNAAVAPLGQVIVGTRAARTMVAELARHTGPKTGLLVTAEPDSPVLTAAVEALLPEDSLTVVAPDLAAMHSHLAELGTWVSERVRVVDSLAAADPADVVVVGDPVIGSAEEARATLDSLGKLVNPGGVVVVAAIAVPGVAPAAAAELDRQAMLYGVGTDLLLRNMPPLKIHRLRWTAADPKQAERLLPVDRPSSIPLTSRIC